MALTKLAEGEKESVYYKNGKKLWEVYTGMGRASSYMRLRKWCFENGITGSNGKVDRMMLYWGVWKYIFHNLEEAYPLYKEWQLEYLPELAESGWQPTWENFLKDVRKHTEKSKYKGTPIATKKEYAEFCEKYNLTP